MVLVRPGKVLDTTKAAPSRVEGGDLGPGSRGCACRCKQGGREEVSRGAARLADTSDVPPRTAELQLASHCRAG